MQRAHIKVVGNLNDHPRKLPSCHVSNRPIIVVEIELSDRFSTEPLVERKAKVRHRRNYKYLILGGGMTAAAMGDGIREVDSTGSIGLVDAEQDLLYDCPSLTKGALQAKAFGQPLVRQEERWVDDKPWQSRTRNCCW